MSSEYHYVPRSNHGEVILPGIDQSFYKNQNVGKRSIPDIAAGVPLIDPSDQTNEGQENTDDRLIQDVSSTDILAPSNDGKVQGEIRKIKDRGNWSGRFDFLMSLLGYSVGLGNVWRFPYLAYSNGGGAFVFPFVLMLLMLGIPLMFMELALGQYAGLGPAVIFNRFCPLFHGLGYGMILVSGLVSVYYTVIIAWCILYLVLSFTSELPWQSCNPEWATPYCYSFREADVCHATNGSVFLNNTCYDASIAYQLNLTETNANHSVRHVPAQDYFEVDVLKMSSGIEVMGAVQWKIALSLLAAWTMAFAALSKGVKSSGKVVYFTALFPYVVLCILFVRGVTLPGSVDGIVYYLTPRFDKLGDAKVWNDAAAQIFFALSPAWGGLITLASYNKFENNCFKDALIVSIGNVCTSIFAGFVIFSIIGYLAAELKMPVDEVVAQGAGLAFFVYPDVVTRLPISPLWSILFFVMMITLGMGTELALVETVMTGLQDAYPRLRNYKTWAVMAVSIIGVLSGLALTTQGGMYLLQLMDAYVSSWGVFMMAGLECVIIGWIYGGEEFLHNIEMMLGHSSRSFRLFFLTFWKILTPVTLLAVMVFNLIQQKPLTLDKYVFPGWANVIGWMLSGLPLFFIIATMVYQIKTAVPQEIGITKRIKVLLKPSQKWCPANKALDKREAVKDSNL